MEVAAVEEARGVEFGDAPAGLAGAGGAGAGGVARQERGAVQDVADGLELSGEAAGPGAGGVGRARRVAALERDAAVGDPAREAADVLLPLGGAEGVAVGEGRRIARVAREAARVGVAAPRGRGVAQRKAFRDGGAAAGKVADEAARVVGAGRRARRHAAQEVVGRRDVAREAADVVGGALHAAEGRAPLVADARGGALPGEAARAVACRLHGAVRLAPGEPRAAAFRSADEPADAPAAGNGRRIGLAAREIVRCARLAGEPADRAPRRPDLRPARQAVLERDAGAGGLADEPADLPAGSGGNRAGGRAVFVARPLAVRAADEPADLRAVLFRRRHGAGRGAVREDRVPAARLPDEAAGVAGAADVPVRLAVSAPDRPRGVADETADVAGIRCRHVAFGPAVREGGAAAVFDVAGKAALVVAARAGDGDVRGAVPERDRGVVDVAHETARVRAGGLDRAFRPAPLEGRAVRVVDAPDEHSGAAIRALHRPARGAVADRRRALHFARQRADVLVAVHVRVLQHDADEGRVLGVAEEPRVGAVRVAGGRVVEREAGDGVPLPVQRTGERRGGSADGRPGRVGEVDVRAQRVGAAQAVRDGFQLLAGGDQRAELGRDGAEVVHQHRRFRAGGVRIGRVAAPAQEHGTLRHGLDGGRRAGLAGAEPVDGARARPRDLAAERHLAVRERPREVGLSEPVRLRPFLRLQERREVVGVAHPGRVERVDARDILRANVRQAVVDAEAVREGRGVAVLPPHEAADFGRADRRAGRVAAREGTFAVAGLPGKAADVVASLGRHERIAVREGRGVADESGEAADAVARRFHRPAGEALGEGRRVVFDAADEPAEIASARGGHVAEREAAREGGIVFASNEPAGVAACRGERAGRAAVRDLAAAGDFAEEEAGLVGGGRNLRALDRAADDGRFPRVARERGGVGAAAHHGIRERDVHDRRAVEVAEEAGVGAAVGVHRQAGNHVALPVDRAGEGRVVAVADRRPVFARQVDVRAETVDAGEVVRDGREPRAVGDGDSPDAPRRAVVVREQRRLRRGRVGVARAARPAAEERVVLRDGGNGGFRADRRRPGHRDGLAFLLHREEPEVRPLRQRPREIRRRPVLRQAPRPREIVARPRRRLAARRLRERRRARRPRLLHAVHRHPRAVFQRRVALQRIREAVGLVVAAGPSPDPHRAAEPAVRDRQHAALVVDVGNPAREAGRVLLGAADHLRRRVAVAHLGLVVPQVDPAGEPRRVVGGVHAPRREALAHDRAAGKGNLPREARGRAVGAVRERRNIREHRAPRDLAAVQRRAADEPARPRAAREASPDRAVDDADVRAAHGLGKAVVLAGLVGWAYVDLGIDPLPVGLHVAVRDEAAAPDAGRQPREAQGILVVRDVGRIDGEVADLRAGRDRLEERDCRGESAPRRAEVGDGVPLPEELAREGADPHVLPAVRFEEPREVEVVHQRVVARRCRHARAAEDVRPVVHRVDRRAERRADGGDVLHRVGRGLRRRVGETVAHPACERHVGVVGNRLDRQDRPRRIRLARRLAIHEDAALASEDGRKEPEIGVRVHRGVEVGA